MPPSASPRAGNDSWCSPLWPVSRMGLIAAPTAAPPTPMAPTAAPPTPTGEDSPSGGRAHNPSAAESATPPRLGGRGARGQRQSGDSNAGGNLRPDRTDRVGHDHGQNGQPADEEKSHLGESVSCHGVTLSFKNGHV